MGLELAKLEAKMFRLHEINSQQANLREEKKATSLAIEKMLSENGLDMHTVSLDENTDLKAALKRGDKKVFEKERMAEDLGVAESATQKKDFLINMTEKGKLTLRTFKGYFAHEPETKLSLRTVKAKPKKK